MLPCSASARDSERLTEGLYWAHRTYNYCHACRAVQEQNAARVHQGSRTFRSCLLWYLANPFTQLCKRRHSERRVEALYGKICAA